MAIALLRWSSMLVDGEKMPRPVLSFGKGLTTGPPVPPRFIRIDGDSLPYHWRLYITIITQRNDAWMWQNVFVFQFLPVVLVSSVSSWAPPRETYVPPAANVCRPVNSTRSATIIHGRRTTIVRRATHTCTPYGHVVKHRLCGRTRPAGWLPRELVRRQRTRARAHAEGLKT